MKRDLELIRSIMVTIEEADSMQPFKLEFDDQSEEVINFHILLLEEAGLIQANIESDETGEIILAEPIRLTWNGFEFLQNARNESIWKKAIKTLGDKSISVSVSILSELLKSLIKETIGMHN